MKTSTTAPGGIMLNLRSARHRAHGVASWPTRAAALAALAALRARGLNCERHIEIQRAASPLWRFWVIGRPDHFEGVTYLMTADGGWIRGRLLDAPPCWCEPSTPACVDGHTGAPWEPFTAVPEPATFTHVTRTVADTHNQRERYRARSNGSCGRYVWSDDSIALCTCGWKQWASTRDGAQAAARDHRTNPDHAAANATPQGV